MVSQEVSENWFELAIIAFIMVGIGAAVWRGGQANPEGTGKLRNTMGDMDKDVRALRGEVKGIERRVVAIENHAAKASDIERLERLMADQNRTIEQQSLQLAKVGETVAASRAAGEQRGKQLDRLYDFIVERGMEK